MKLYITRLHVEFYGGCCPDEPHGIFLNKEDADKLARHNFEDYCETWGKYDTFKILNEEFGKYELEGDGHLWMSSYVEEIELADNQMDLTQVKDNKTMLYFTRPEISRGYEKMPYLAFTNKEEALCLIDKWYDKYYEIAKEKHGYSYLGDDRGDRSLYADDFCASFFLEMCYYVTNLDEYLNYRE